VCVVVVALLKSSPTDGGGQKEKKKGNETLPSSRHGNWALITYPTSRTFLLINTKNILRDLGFDLFIIDSNVFIDGID
jgi:hypothetical protein